MRQLKVGFGGGFRGVQGLRSPGNIYLICWGSDICIRWYWEAKKMKNAYFPPNSLLCPACVCVCLGVCVCEMHDLTGSCRYSRRWKTSKLLNDHSLCHIKAVLLLVSQALFALFMSSWLTCQTPAHWNSVNPGKNTHTPKWVSGMVIILQQQQHSFLISSLWAPLLYPRL